MSTFAMHEDRMHDLERALALSQLLADTMAELGIPGRTVTTVPAVQVAALGEAIARDLQAVVDDCRFSAGG